MTKDKKEINENALVEITDQSGVEKGVEMLVMKNASLLPNNVATERIKASAGFYVSNNPDLMKLDKANKMKMLYGILKEAMVGCEAGVDYDIIPFKVKGVPTPTIIRKKEGWFKVIDLVKPADIVRFTTNVITTGDDFYFNPVTEELEHEMHGERYQDYKNILGAYAYIKLANGFEKTVFMSKEDIDKVKNGSPSGASEYSPWNSNSIKMVKAKVVKELAKEMFTLYSGRVNSVLAGAIESDEMPVAKVSSSGYIINDKEVFAQDVEEPVVVDAEIDDETPKTVNINEI